MTELVHLELGEQTVLRLDNPPLNLVTAELTRQLREALHLVARAADVRVLIVHGGERAFCAGSDIKEFADLYGRVAEGKLLLEKLVYRQLARLPMPTIAAIEGPALGGGLELALCCDLRVAGEGATFGMPELRLGVVPGSGGTQRLPRIVGPTRAKELIFLGEILGSDEAERAGLLTRRSARGGALGVAHELAAVISSRGPVAMRVAKRLLDDAVERPLEEGLALELDGSEVVFSSEDAREGATAFFEKRPPRFSGR